MVLNESIELDLNSFCVSTGDFGNFIVVSVLNISFDESIELRDSTEDSKTIELVDEYIYFSRYS
jgi:hypothetical protein